MNIDNRLIIIHLFGLRVNNITFERDFSKKIICMLTLEYDSYKCYKRIVNLEFGFRAPIRNLLYFRV